MMPSEIPAARVYLDVCEVIQRGEEPFARIMAAVNALAADQALVLRVPFEPIPLYKVLGKRGFAHWAECRAADDWSVGFYRDRAPSRGIADGGLRGFHAYPSSVSVLRLSE